MKANLAVLLDPFACIAFGRSGTDGPSKQAVIVPTAVRSRSEWQFHAAARWPAERRKVRDHVAGSERLGDFVDMEDVLRGSEKQKQQRIAYLSALFKHARASCVLEGVEWKGLHVLVPSYVIALLSPKFVVGPDGKVSPAVFEAELESAELNRDIRLAAAHAGFERTAVSPNYFHVAQTACRNLQLQRNRRLLGCVVEIGLGGIGFLPFSLETGKPAPGENLHPFFIAWDVRSFLLERLRDSAIQTPQLARESEIEKELLAYLPVRLINDAGHSEIDITIRGEPVVLTSSDPVFGADWAPLNARIRDWLAQQEHPLIPDQFVEQLTGDSAGVRYFARYTLSGSLVSLPRMDAVLDELVCADPESAPRQDKPDENGPLGILDHTQVHAVLAKLPSMPIPLADPSSQALSDASLSAEAVGQGVYTFVRIGQAPERSVEEVVRENMTQPQILLFDTLATAPTRLGSSRSWTVEIPVMLRSGIYDGVSREFRVVFHLMPWNLGQRLEIELKVLPSHRALLTATIAGVVAAADVVPKKIAQLEQYPNTVRDDLEIEDASSLVRCIELGRFELMASPLHRRLTDALDAGEISHSFSTMATE